MRLRRTVILAPIPGVVAALAAAAALAGPAPPDVQRGYVWVQPPEAHAVLPPAAGDPTAQPPASVATVPAAVAAMPPPSAGYPWVQPPAPGFAIASPPQEALRWVQPPEAVSVAAPRLAV